MADLSPSRPESPYEQAYSEATTTLSLLHDVLSALREQLEPVLIPDPPSPAVQDEEEESGARVVRDLRRITWNVHIEIDRVQSILNRLQI